ncbi:hypothetical protein JYU34_002548 [Plutella xylostella]|uniref:FP protein C-terminal domain-containing protein n=1 Tax=Plutella xylostella TaxID=51655 RepID=A0ABQ7QIR6_PLUXY|nr:hypothetical protein JYU34_019969 [Plutella xylostella]KAG7305064.1 hypothetical protein JYU34_010522 [Plutella xylostella]KAG7311504.1 hypothetical protein JYU34_002548 [Plutella xylostella]
MNMSLEKSSSEPELSVTPTNFAVTRIKRRREEDSIGMTELSTFRDEMMKSMAALFANSDKKICQMVSSLKEVQESNRGIVDSISLLTEQNKLLQDKILSLESQRREDSEYISLLENKIEDLQMSNRKANFELKNVPRKNNESKEDLIEMVVQLSNTVGCEITKKDIKDIYRVRGKTDSSRNTPIIVETGSTLTKSELMKMCKLFNIKHKSKLTAKHLGFRKDEDVPIFISENLTSKGARLHFLARDLVKSKNYKFCWTAYGKVYVRRDENSQIINIKSEAQCTQLMNAQ